MLTLHSPTNKSLRLLRVLGDAQRSNASKFYFGVYSTFDIDGLATTTPAGNGVVMLHFGLLLTVPMFALSLHC
jgi:hypothetical protein